MASTESQKNAELLLLAAYRGGVNDPKELANFMAQMQVESQGFTKAHESLNYSAERLLAVFPGRNGMDTLKEAKAIVAGGQERIAEAIYGGKWGEGLGNKPNSGDSFDFRGRGFVQLTGRSNYEHYGKAIGLDLAKHPELAAEPKNAAALAVQYWKERVVDRGLQHDVTSATKGINGGHKALAERQAAAVDWQHKLTPEVMAGLSRGEVALPMPTDHRGTPRQGAHGESIAELQTKLSQLGYTGADGSALRSDGNLGPDTRHAVKAFQHDNHLAEDGVAGRNTMNVLDVKLKEQALAPPPRQEPGIQDSPLYKQAHTALEKIDAQFSRKPDQLTDNAAAAVAVAAQKAGLTRIDHIEPGGPDNSKLFAVQGKPGTAHSKVIDVPTVEAMNTPMAQSAKAFEETRQAQQQAVQQPQVTQPSQQQAAPSLSH